MSYILDALKKADAEREQGQVPGLHTPTAHSNLEEGPRLHTPPRWAMGLGTLLVLVALGAVWQWTRPVAPPAVAQPASTPTAMPPPPVPVRAPAITPAATLPQSAPTAVPEAVATTQPSPSQRSVTRAETVLPRTIVTTPRAPVHVDPAPAPAPSKQVPTLAELPDEVRRSLPPLAVSGAMYSDNPANRMLLINNRVFHEGDQPAAGLVLEEIRLKSAVFRYRGTRYAVSY